jgi:O-antigen ligase
LLLYIRSNIEFLLIVTAWYLVGYNLQPIAYGLVLFSFLLFWRKEKYSEILIGFMAMLIFADNPSLSFAKDLKPFLLPLLSLFFFFNRKKFIPLCTLYFPFLYFFIYSFILLFASETFFTSLQKTVSYALLYIVVPNYLVKIYRERGPVFFKEWILFITILLWIGIVLYFVNPSVVFSHGNRFKGIMGNPNGIAMFSVFIFISYSVIKNQYHDLFSREEKILILIPIFLSIVWSSSRASIFAVLIFIVFSNIGRKSIFLNIALFIIVAIVYQVFTENLPSIISYFNLQSYFRLETLKKGGGRFVAWQFAWEQIQKNFFFGKGFDYNQYLFFIPENQSKLNMLDHQGDVHNVYLGFWLDVGIVGLCIFFSAFFYTFYKMSLISHQAIPAMYSMLFLGMYEPWLISSLNSYTINFLVIATIMLYCQRANAAEKAALEPVYV